MLAQKKFIGGTDSEEHDLNELTHIFQEKDPNCVIGVRSGST